VGDDPRLFSAAAARNGPPILSAIGRHLPEAGLLLEVASGSGQHAVLLARARPGLRIQPSDPRPEARASIAAWSRAEALTNVLPPLDLDVTAPSETWPVQHADAVLAVNLLHVAPPAASAGLFAGTGRVLEAGGPLFVYGPFVAPDRPTAPSNLAFDAALRGTNPAWGLRRTDRLAREAEGHGLDLVETVSMPANNLLLVFRCRAGP